MATQHIQSHVVLSSAPRMGHLRGICALAGKLAADRPITVTLLVSNEPKSFAAGKAEAMRCMDVVDTPKGKLRVIAFGEAHEITHERLMTAEKDAFTAVWTALLAESSIKCSITGEEHQSVVKPALIILSGMQYALFQVIRDTQLSPPLFVYQPATAAGIAQVLLPPHLGGSVDDTTKPFTVDERKNGRALSTKGDVIKTPGLPPMYDWELYPGDIEFFGVKPGVMHETSHIFLRAMSECDGILTANCPAFDGEPVLAAMDKWAAESGRLIFNLGPMRPLIPGTTDMPESSLDAEIAASPPGVGAKVISFLDEMLHAKGRESVVYICLGSMFWPVPNPEFMWALLEALIERDIPFILSHASPFAKIPEHFQTCFGINGTENGLIVPWAPQQTLLAHKAVGWFVTHGGAGGTMDALTQGVPMIGWPFAGDQPCNIAYLTHSADVAFELTEVHTSPWARKPRFASGKTPAGTLEAFKVELAQVLGDMTGEVGARKRANARRMQSDLAKAWAEGGSSRSAFDAFTEKYGL